MAKTRHTLLLVAGLVVLGATLVLCSRDDPPEETSSTRGRADGADAGTSRRRTERQRASTDGPREGTEPPPREDAAVEPDEDPDPAGGNAIVGRKGASPTERLAGRVVDAATGRPIPDARVVRVTVVPGKKLHDWGGRGDPAGAFVVSYAPDPPDTQHVELRVVAPGYRVARVAAEEGAEVRLERLDHEPLPGRIRGVAVDAEGKPVNGRIAVEGFDEMHDWAGQWVVADAGGGFTMDGVPPGAWNFQDADPAIGVGWVEVTVPEGGEARMQVRVRSAEPLAPPVPPDGASVDGGTEFTVLAIPDAPGATLTARGDTHLFWRSAVRDGAAAFAGIQPGRWKFVLHRPGHPNATMTVEVPRGVSLATFAPDAAPTAR